jgi:hypothetical protein
MVSACTDVHYDSCTSTCRHQGSAPSKEPRMKSTLFKSLGRSGVATIVLVGALVLGSASHAGAAGDHDAARRTLEGTWWVQVTTLSDCTSRTPLASFAALLTFAEGGTMTGTTTNGAFAIGQRSPDHGVWERTGAAHTYRASSIALLLFTTAPNFPVSPGFQAGSQRLDQAIKVTDSDHFTSHATTEFYDVSGQTYRTGCATALGRRFE